MSKILEDMKEESFQKGFQESVLETRNFVALRMLQAGKYPLEEISDISGLSLDEVKKLSADSPA